MLEMIILLEILLKKFTEAWVIAFLILLNACISFFEEGKLIPAHEIVTDDISGYFL